jgi:hypothetical protein
MRGKVMLVIWFVAMISVFTINGAATADVITPLNPQLKENLQNISKIMLSLSNELNTGKMSIGAQDAAAEITKQVGEILQKLSEGSREFNSQKEGIDAMMKMWQPFTEASLTGN